MPSLRSSVLIVGHPEPAQVHFGADFADDLLEAQNKCAEFRYSVVVVPSDLTRGKAGLGFFDHLNEISPFSQRVVIQSEMPAEELRKIINKGHIFKILPSFQSSLFDLTIQEALEEYRLIQQNSQLMDLVREQNENLKKLTSELEDRVEKRQKFLEDARERLLTTNHRVEALHRAFVAVHRASSIGEMERLINEALRGALQLSWTRIHYSGSAHISPQQELLYSLYRAPLMRGKENLGEIHFARESGQPFVKDEIGFISQVAEAVSLAIDRLTKLQQSETLKLQWEATFDAINEPVSLIDSNYTIARVNRSYIQNANASGEKIIGRKCYEALFGRTEPCENCHIGKDFRLNTQSEAGSPVIYEVFSQAIPAQADEPPLYVNMYHDISAQLHLERQIVEAAKMVELGTIGSSIAHELNNPLAGMLSFLELIKMDLGGGESYYDDIVEMEKGARRCRDIVQNLLGFTRNSTEDESQLIDFREVIHQALKITELQTRAMGISVHLNLGENPALIRAHPNYLAQAIRHFLQAAQNSIAERSKQEVRFKGVLNLSLSTDSTNHVVLLIEDNGMPTKNTSTETLDLGLTVAKQILTDHKAQLEILTEPGKRSAKISF
jgi:two-component system NtrC family sensor kinase